MVDLKNSNENLYKKVFWIILALMLFMMVYQSCDYGMNWDEPLSKTYGDYVLKFYLSFGKDRSLESDPNGAVRAMVFYGAFVEVIASIINKFSSRDPYDNHHLVTAIFGFIGVLFCGLTAKVLSGWRAAIISACFLFATPVYFANSMHNSKDIPFAVGTIASLYFIIVFLKEWPKINHSVCSCLAIAIAVTIGVRAGGIILIAYLGLFFLAKNLYSFFQGEYTSKQELLKQITKGIFPLGIISLASYIISLLFWPYALLNPVNAPTKALGFLSNINAFDSYNLFEGRWIHRWEIPWYYIPKWIIVTTPLFISLAPILLVVLLVLKKKIAKEQMLFSTMLLFAFVFPIFFIVIKKSNVYDGWRHMYFVYPPLVVVCALIWENLLSINKIQAQLVLSIVLLILFLEPFFFMLSNHPNEQFYFSPLIGGINGAFKNYEIDYYGTSLRGAIEWLATNSKAPKFANKIRVNSLYGENVVAKYYISKYSKLVYVESQEEADYLLLLPAFAKHNHEILFNWPPQNTVYQIMVDNVPIVAILKNINNDSLVTQLKPENKDVTPAYFIDLSLKLFQAQDYANVVVAAEKALSLDPNNATAYNNICSAFNSLLLFEEAVEAGKKAFELKPDFDLAKNNYQYALSKINEEVDLKIKVQNYIKLSSAFYNDGNSEQTINFANKALKYEPNNALVYNNLCLAYIQSKEIDKAIEAAEKALKLDPNSETAKKNLVLAKSQKL
jgi:tetratricopeptide (TPR) repeat protein